MSLILSCGIVQKKKKKKGRSQSSEKTMWRAQGVEKLKKEV